MDRVKGNAFKYECSEMSQYFTPIENDLSISEKKCFIKFSSEDVDLDAKRKWNSDTYSCLNCPEEQSDQRHVLNCQFF